MAEIRKATHDLNGMTSQDTQGQRMFSALLQGRSATAK